MRTKINRGVQREIIGFQNLLQEITQKGKGVTYFRIGLETEKPIQFKEGSILRLVRVALCYFYRTENYKELVNEVYVESAFHQMMLKILFDALKDVTKKSSYFCNVLTYEILFALDIIVDDGFKTKDDKASMMAKHTQPKKT